MILSCIENATIESECNDILKTRVRKLAYFHGEINFVDHLTRIVRSLSDIMFWSLYLNVYVYDCDCCGHV